MAATVGILNGIDILVYNGTNAFAHATDCSLQVSMALRDASTKSSVGWKANLPGQRSWQISTNGLIAMDVQYNFANLVNLAINQTKLTIYFKTSNSSDYSFSGYAYLTSVQASAPNNANATYSASFEGTDALTLTNPGGM